MAIAERKHREMLTVGHSMLSLSSSPRIVETAREAEEDQNRLVLVNKV